MTKIMELLESTEKAVDETTIVIKSNIDGINMIQVDDSSIHEAKGRIKDTFDMFLETDKKIKDIELLIKENQKEKERLQYELGKHAGKLKRLAFEQ